jgi:FkbM family methyltransferase
MSLSSMLHNTPLYRPACLPQPGRDIIILYSNDDIQNINSIFKNYKIQLVISAKQLNEASYYDRIHISCDFEKILNFSGCCIVIFSTTENYPLLFFFSEEIRKLGIQNYHIYMDTMNKIHTRYYPGHFNENRKQLEYTYNLLSDDESRMILASRIRSVIEGDNGYIRRSKYEHYCHPEIKIQKGDIILDCGVSGDIGVVSEFSKCTGDKGHVYAFEPDPICYSEAQEKIKNNNINNVDLIQCGLWNKSETINMKINGGASYVTDTKDENTVICHMTTIDTIVSENNIKKVDMIELDVEGSEMNALLGGVKTIEKYRPKLLVSVYHKWPDIFELPLFINELDLNYKFYMGHHSPIQWETVLYAVP